MPEKTQDVNTTWDYGPINIQSGRVTKQPHDSGGKTADRVQVCKAPPDRYFVEDSWHLNQISAHGKNAGVHFESFKRMPIDVTLPNGKTVKIAVVTEFVVRAHAETGSGYTKDVRTAWAEAEIFADLEEFT
jgi:hypothetical protein